MNRKEGLNNEPRALIERIHNALTSTREEIMKSVLLVDDDSILLLGIGVRLKSMGYVVFTAKDAVSAVSAVVKNDPDVVVLDVSLPAGDGFLVAGRLRNLVGSAATPIIFITASENPQLRERAAHLGAAAFLIKPFDATTLADAIETALSPGDFRRAQASGE
jgi:CheY-like chemotaxis protein